MTLTGNPCGYAALIKAMQTLLGTPLITKVNKVIKDISYIKGSNIPTFPLEYYTDRTKTDVINDFDIKNYIYLLYYLKHSLLAIT